MPGQVLSWRFLPPATATAPKTPLTATSGQHPHTNPSLSPPSCHLRVFGHRGAAAAVGSRPQAAGPGGLPARGGDGLQSHHFGPAAARQQRALSPPGTERLCNNTPSPSLPAALPKHLGALRGPFKAQGLAGLSSTCPEQDGIRVCPALTFITI